MTGKLNQMELRSLINQETARYITSPQLPIVYKLAVRMENPRYANAGVSEAELPIFIPALDAAGITSFHVALADHGKQEDTILDFTNIFNGHRIVKFDISRYDNSSDAAEDCRISVNHTMRSEEKLLC